MPNGFHGSKAELEQLELPLLALDPILQTFAQSHNIEFAKNLRGEVNRALTWGGELKRLVQLYVDDPAVPSWKLWVCVSQDRGGARFWRQKTLLSGVAVEAFSASLHASLEQAYAEANSWDASQLEFATTIQPLP